MKTILFLLLPVFGFSQVTITKMEWLHAGRKSIRWSYVAILSNGDSVMEGQSLKLGKGTMPNGDFKYIATASNTDEAKLKRATKLTEVTVGEINRKGNEKYGYKYIFRIDGGYYLQLENAVATGEIIL